MSWLIKEAGVIIPPDYEEILDAVQRRVEEPVTLSSIEYQDLLKNITALLQVGIPSRDIKDTLGSAPMETVQDIGDMKAKLWTLATVDYGISRERLMERMSVLETTK